MRPMSEENIPPNSENELSDQEQAMQDAQADMAALDALRTSSEQEDQGPDEEIDLEDIADAFEPGAFADIEKLKVELAETKDQLMRALADAENTRRRAIRERQDAGKFAAAGFARDMLDIADNLRRALDSMPEELIAEQPQVKNLHEGIEGTEKLLLSTFEKNGIKRLDPAGEIFDPNFHEVMFEAPMPDKPAGTVMQVLEVGYTLNDRLLRPARVGVVKDDGQVEGDTPAGEAGSNIDTEA